MITNNSQREQWSSKIGFILAAAGSAIGLGNIWKFPYIAGENGGAAFIIIYLVCVAVIGLPVLSAEVLIGRTARKNPVGAFKALSGSKFWTTVGGMGVLTGFVILSFYAVVAGWTLGYIYQAISGSFYDFPEAASSGEHFNDLVGNVGWTLGYFALFMSLTIFIVYKGVKNGIERASKIMMPVLFILLLILMIRGLTLHGASEGIEFLFKPDWSQVTGNTILLALGHAFFTLSIGMGAMLTYGSYMSNKNSVPGTSLQVVALDTSIAIIAGIAIFTVVFATLQDPAAGPGLIFHTLPVVFTKIPGGYFFSILFFVLLTIAALTSAISLLEVVTAYFVDEKGWKRKNAAIVFGGLIFLIGIPNALSFNLLSDFFIAGKTFFDIADFVSSNILLPLGGLLMAVFVGWVWGFDKVIPELKLGAGKIFERYSLLTTSWKLLIKYIAPVLIFLVMLSVLGII